MLVFTMLTNVKLLNLSLMMMKEMFPMNLTLDLLSVLSPVPDVNLVSEDTF